MKKRILTGLTLLLTVFLTFGLLSAADKPASSVKRKGKKAAMIAKLLPPELHRSLNLVPEDAIAVGFVNAEAITKGKLFPEMMKSAGMDWDTLLAATGGKKEDTDACALFYVKLTPAAANDAAASPMPAMEIGGSIVYKLASTVREQFEKPVEELRKGVDGLAQADKDAKVEKIKIGDRDAILVSMPSRNMTVLSIAAGKNVVQFRCFFNTKPVMALIPARGEVTSLASSLNLTSAFAIAVDGVKVRALVGEALDSPELKSIRLASCSVTEKEKGLSVVLRIASDLDGVKLIQPQIKQALEGMKEDPMWGPIAAKTTVTVKDSTNVVVRSFIPSEMILQNLELYKTMNEAGAAQAEPSAKPAPKSGSNSAK